MTGDPQRLLSLASDADDAERELLRSIPRMSPPAHAKDQAWQRIAGQIGGLSLVVGGAAAVGEASAAPHLAKAALEASVATAKSGLALTVPAVKIALALSVTGGLIGAGAAWFGRGESMDRAPAPAAAAAAVAKSFMSSRVAASASAPSACVGCEVELVATRSSSAALAPRVPESGKVLNETNRPDRVAAESALLAKARAQLRGGDLRATRLTLSRIKSEFPRGVLGQERDVLAIEVLAAEGNTAAARQRARAFVLAHPESPHSAKLARFVDTP